MKTEMFDTDILRNLEKMSYKDAANTAVELIKTSKTKNEKKQHLIRDILSANSANEVSRIMWNTMLAGSGLSVTGSKWQKQYA